MTKEEIDALNEALKYMDRTKSMTFYNGTDREALIKAAKDYVKHADTVKAIESGEYVLVPRDSSKYDVQTIMTCPYIIKNVSFRPENPVYLIEPVMIEVVNHTNALNHEDVAFFKAYSKEEAKYISRREWFKKIHKAIISAAPSLEKMQNVPYSDGTPSREWE